MRMTPVFAAGLEVTRQIADEGFIAYVVGGAVRDLILGKDPNEIDIASNAPPEVIKELFPGARRVFPFEYQVFAICGENWRVEIARMREDVKTFGRQAQVRFTDDMDKDLARRDFTINAMAVLPDRTFVDKFRGYKDLQHRTIRTIGEPATRFEQDHLRIVRAIRFAAQLDFEFAADTERAIENLVHLCADLSPAWLWREFRKGISAAGRFAELLKKYRLGQVLFGEFVDFEQISVSGIRCVFRRTRTEHLLWAFFFYDGAPDFFQRMSKVAGRMEFPRTIRKRVLHTARMIDQLRTHKNLPPRELARFLTDPQISSFLDCADCFEDLAPMVSTLRKEFPNIGRVSPPDGNTLRAQGLSGEQLGEALAQLTLEMLRGEK